MRPRPFASLVLLACSRLLLPAQTVPAPTVPAPTVPAPAAPATPAAPQTRSCPVDPTPSSLGEQQLSREDFKGAEATFRAELVTHSDGLAAHLGLVRALIGEDRVADAHKESMAMSQTKTAAALGEVAVSEADYRAAEIDAALTHAQAALAIDPCEAQAASAMADVLGLLGMNARSARLLAQAHHLRPNDELIRRSWIGSLPISERQPELARYLGGPHNLSPDREQSYSNALTYLKARRPGECKVISKAETARIPLRPVFGDNARPVAFGLDLDLNQTRRRMQIDTGASGIILTPGAARALKLEPEYKLKAAGIGDEGKVESYLAHVKSIRIGEVEIQDCLVEVLGKSKLHVDGLIGMNVFSHFLVTLNYPDAQLQLDSLPIRPPQTQNGALSDQKEQKPALNDAGVDTGPRDRYTPPEFKDWTHVIRIGHQILLPAAFKPGTPPHFLIMDTGASRSVLSPAMAQEAGKLHSSGAHLVGISGAAKTVFQIDPAQLRVANLQLPAQGFFAYDLTSISHNNGFETSGLLGLPTLQRLTLRIDYRDNLLQLSYDRKHDVIRF